MNKSFSRLLGAASIFAIMCSAGAMAADTSLIESIDSRQWREIVPENQRAQYRHEERLQRQVNGSAGVESGEGAHKRLQSREQKRYKTQTMAHSRAQVSRSGGRGMGGGGRSGGGGRR